MSAPARVTVVGAGSWGTALANVLAGNGHQVLMWAFEEDVAEAVNRDHVNPRYLPGMPLHEGLSATSDLGAAVSAAGSMLVWVVPSHVTRQVFTQALPHLAPEVPIVSATKGIEVDTQQLMTGVFEELLGDGGRDRIGVLSGPSFAKEVVAGAPTGVAAAAWNPAVGERAQALFGSRVFRVYTNNDPIGTQVGGALKNVVAIAAGAVEGLGLGYNTQAVLITRGLSEIARLGVAMGGQAATFAGLSGIGDLVLTCTGGLSRNRQVGIALGQGQKLEHVLAQMEMVAEGVKTTAGAHKVARELGVDMPIVEQVHRALFEGVTATEALDALMSRPQCPEDELVD